MSGVERIGSLEAVICEDEPLAIRALREYLADVEWIEVVDEARDGRTAMKVIHKLEPDVVFLDVRMPGLNGLEVLDALSYRPVVVLTTAFDDYAVEAFALGAVDYLVKPFGKQRLLETLDRVRIRLLGEGMARADRGSPSRPISGSSFPPEWLFAKRGNALIPVRPRDIVRVDASTGGCEIVVSGGDTLHLADTLAEVEARLDQTDFVRVHRSHIVNLRHVVAIRPYDGRRLSIRLSDGSSVIASRRGSSDLRSRTS